jgi:hypothetical protein
MSVTQSNKYIFWLQKKIKKIDPLNKHNYFWTEKYHQCNACTCTHPYVAHCRDTCNLSRRVVDSSFVLRTQHCVKK